MYFSFACSRCILFSRLYASVVYIFPTTYPPFASIKLDYWLECTPTTLTTLVCSLALPPLLLCRVCGCQPHSIAYYYYGVSLPPSFHCVLLLGCLPTALVELPNCITQFRVCLCRPHCITQFRVCLCHLYCMHLWG